MVIGSYITTMCLLMRHIHAELVMKHQITKMTQSPLKPRFGTLRLLALPKIKSPLRRKRFQTISEIQENSMGQLIAIPTKGFAECLNSGRDTGKTV